MGKVAAVHKHCHIEGIFRALISPHTFYSLTLGVGSWSVSCCGPSNQPKEGWFGPTAGLHHGSDEKIPVPVSN